MKIIVFISVMMLVAGCNQAGQDQDTARTLISLGAEQYADQKYASAADTFREAASDPDSDWAALASFNLGNALYRMTNHTDAVQSYEQAAHTADTALHADTCYNQALTAYQLMSTVTNLTAEQAMSRLRDIMELYQKSLLLNPELNDARINFELTLQQLMTVRGFLSHVDQTMTKSARLVEGRKYAVAADLLKTSMEEYARFYESFPQQQKKTAEYLKRIQDIIGILEAEPSAANKKETA